MPKLPPTKEVLPPFVTTTITAWLHVRRALIWHVARQSGIEPPHPPLTSGRVLTPQARRLPAELKATEPTGRLFYQVRTLALLLHWHPSAGRHGGAEQWWQQCLDEYLVGVWWASQPAAQSHGDPQRSIARWWMRRGINTCNPVTEPATWALIEAIQGRVFRNRGELTSPEWDAPLPAVALTGAMPLVRRRELLYELTRRSDGWEPKADRMFTRAWSELLKRWQLTAKSTKGRREAVLVSATEAAEWKQIVGVVGQELLLPTLTRIQEQRQVLRQIPSQKLSDDAGFGPPNEIGEVVSPGGLSTSPQETRLTGTTKKEPERSANQLRAPRLSNAPHEEQTAHREKPKPHRRRSEP
jgi:hypothetical protein